VGRRATAEINEMKWSAGNDRQPTVQLHFLNQCGRVSLNITSVLIGVDAKIAKLAAFPTKRNVQIKTKGSIRPRRFFQGLASLGQMRWFPERERRIVGNEIVAQARFLLCGFRDGHYSSFPRP